MVAGIPLAGASSDFSPLVTARANVADTLHMEGGIGSNLLRFLNGLSLPVGDRKWLRIAPFGNAVFVVRPLLDKKHFLGYVRLLVRMKNRSPRLHIRAGKKMGRVIDCVETAAAPGP